MTKALFSKLMIMIYHNLGKSKIYIVLNQIDVHLITMFLTICREINYPSYKILTCFEYRLNLIGSNQQKEKE